jgi:prepilin-type N-terminal cleavage/methylation domain-containing protein
MRSLSRRGFTLIELMIVVVVIGILAAIAIPKYNVSAHRSKEKEADLFLSAVYRLQEVYQVQYGVPAAGPTDLARVGFETPTLKYYTYANNVSVPQCLVSTGSWSSRAIDADGNIDDCATPSP